MFPTAAHYTHYYIQEMICHNDYDENKTNGGIRTLFYNLHESITIYLDQIIESNFFNSRIRLMFEGKKVLCQNKHQLFNKRFYVVNWRLFLFLSLNVAIYFNAIQQEYITITKNLY